MDDVGGIGGRSPSPPPLKGNPDVGDLPPMESGAEDALVVDAKPSTLASPSNDKDASINSKVRTFNSA